MHYTNINNIKFVKQLFTLHKTQFLIQKIISLLIPTFSKYAY